LGKAQSDDAVCPGFGPADVQIERTQNPAELPSEGRCDEFLAIAERVAVGAVLDEEEEHLRVAFDEPQVIRATLGDLVLNAAVAVEGFSQRGEHLVCAPMSDGPIQVVLVGEVAVEHRLGHACCPRHLRNAGLRSVLVDRSDGCGNKVGATCFAVIVPARGAPVRLALVFACLSHILNSMSPTWIAFQRAVNVGGRQYPMAQVRQVLTEAGYRGVETHIQTGNIRLESDGAASGLESDLEQIFREDRGFEVETFVLSPHELAAILTEAERLTAEFGEPAHGQYVDLMRSEPSDEHRALIEGQTTDTRRFVVRGRAVHCLSDISMAEVKAQPAAVKRAYGVTTNRNVKVLRAILAKWGEGLGGTD